jgi:peptidoglycan/LPS O-acetylase OafA/YrhL
VAEAEKRVRGIDLLRGLCIIAVMMNHLNLRIRLNQSSFGKWIGPAANNALVWNGHDGVRVFFVISGFLITGWSLKRWKDLPHLNVRQFYAMRFARIVPCLLGLLALLAILDRLGVPRFTINTQHTSLGRALLAALTFHINWLEARTGYLPGAWDILWSLSVEEVFYLFFPILCVSLKKPFLLIPAFCAFIVAGPFARVFTHDLWADYGYLCCMDGIAMGCLAALVCARFKFSRNPIFAMSVVGTVLAALITIFSHLAARIGFYKIGVDETILEIGIALLLIAFQQRFDRSAARANSPAVNASQSEAELRSFWRSALASPTASLRWFGRNSYEVYLTHMLVVWPMVGLFYRTRQSINAGPLWFVLAIVLAGFLGQVVARYYSEPLNRKLRTKLIPRAPRTEPLPEASRQMA